MKKKIPIIIVSVIFSLSIWGSISLSGIYYAEVSVPLKLKDIPGSYAVASPLPKKITLKLKGEGWKLLTLNLGKNVNFVVSANNDTGTKVLNLKNFLAENNWLRSNLDVIDIQPDTVSCIIDRKIKKKLPVFADIHLEFKPGYGLAKDIKIEPESVYVEGPRKILKKLSTISTLPLKLSSLDRKITKSVAFTNFPGTRVNVKNVKITLDVERIVDKEFSEIPVEVFDVPPDRDVVLLPNKISCSLRGGIELLGKLNINKIKAYVHYHEVVMDTLGSIVPHIDNPVNTKLVYIKPERLRYIIKKFR